MTNSLHINLPHRVTVADLRATLAKLPPMLCVTDDVGRSIREIVVDSDGDVTLTSLPQIASSQRDTIKFAIPPELLAMARRSNPEIVSP